MERRWAYRSRTTGSGSPDTGPVPSFSVPGHARVIEFQAKDAAR